MTDIEIVVAKEEHAAIVGGLVHDLIGELSDGQADAPQHYRNTAALVLQLPGVTGALAIRAGQPVGVILLNQCAAIYAGGRFGEITELYVVPEARSGGIAAQLVEWAIAQGRAYNWNRLEVGAPQQPRWRRSLDFYLRTGFVEVGPRLRLAL
ncbi:MAG: GNAT family N-acetyltransferase [Gemmobacter sp.]